MRLLAIDPGFARDGKGCACAAFTHGSLRSVWFERCPEDPASLTCSEELSYVIVERPQADRRSLSVPIQTLITLAWEGATLAAMYAGRGGALLTAPSVRAWKGSEAKPLQHKRLWAVLDQDEREILGGSATELAIRKACEKGALKRWAPGAYYPKSWLTHNLLDAVALGAKHIGRLV